mgnify:FL=1
MTENDLLLRILSHPAALEKAAFGAFGRAMASPYVKYPLVGAGTAGAAGYTGARMLGKGVQDALPGVTGLPGNNLAEQSQSAIAHANDTVAPELHKIISDVKKKELASMIPPWWESEEAKSTYGKVFNTDANFYDRPGYADNTGWFSKNPDGTYKYIDYKDLGNGSSAVSPKSRSNLIVADPGGSDYRVLSDAKHNLSGGLVRDFGDQAKQLAHDASFHLQGLASSPAGISALVGAPALAGMALAGRDQDGKRRTGRGLLRGAATGLGGVLGLAAAKHMGTGLGGTVGLGAGGALAGAALGGLI